ncbi:MAG: hypothetical protein AB7F65_08405 [Dehalococcoidia bacterium]
MVSLPQGQPRYRPDIPRARREQADGLTFRDDALIYAASFALLMVAAVLFFFVLDVYNQDALSRTVDAHNVLYSRDPHLGAIGLVWPPIPTVLRIAILPLTSAVGLTEFTGPITSVIASAGCVVLLNHLLHGFGVPRNTRAAWIVLTFANPVLLYHFVNGTAESVFTFFFLWAVIAALHIREAPERAVLGMGLAIGLALWVRYEALAIMGMAVVGFVLMAWTYRREGAWRERSRFESLLVTLIVPSAALGALWLSFNYTAEGDPLFFYHGPYSINAAPDVAKNAADHALRFAYRSPVGAVQYVGERTFQVSFLFPFAAAAAAVIGLRTRRLEGTLLAFLAVSTLLMQTYQTFTGTIAPWLRYWVYLPVFTVILLGWIGHTYPFWWRTSRLAQIARAGIVPGLLVLANVISLQTMTHTEVGADEQLIVAELRGEEEYAAELRSNYPDREVLERVQGALDQTEGTILVDLQKAHPLITHFDATDRFVINTDRDFGKVLDEPVGSVDYILLPNPRGKGVELNRDAIYTRYPALYDGAAWLELVEQFDGEYLDWRLYRVLDGDVTTP